MALRAKRQKSLHETKPLFERNKSREDGIMANGGNEINMRNGGVETIRINGSIYDIGDDYVKNTITHIFRVSRVYVYS